MGVLRARYGADLDRFLVPPPVFAELGGEFVDFNEQAANLKARFPVEERFLNPYGVVQGGIIAAAIDNTLGPLGMLVAPPNMTRTLEIKYSRPASLRDEFLIVDAKLIEREGRRLFFRAEARTQKGDLLVRAKAMHWIFEN
jgi:acyl-coenzyme A thioesterase PaaI-like protein